MAGEGKGAADEAQVQVAGKPAKGKQGGLSPALIIVGIVALFVATMGSSFLAVSLLGKSRGGGGEAKPAVAEAKKEEAFGPTQEVGSFTVNLADTRERVYVKAGVSVELSGAEAGAELTGREPQVKDIVISVLSSRTMADISTPEGKEALKTELREKISKLLAKGKVKNVFFTEFVFQ